MSNKSRTICLASILAIFLMSLPCVYFLTIQEYVRLAVLGVFILSLLLYYRKDFSKALWRRAAFGVCVIFLFYACDPLTAGGLDLSKDIAPIRYFYAVLTLFFAFLCFISFTIYRFHCISIEQCKIRYLSNIITCKTSYHTSINYFRCSIRRR